MNDQGMALAIFGAMILIVLAGLLLGVLLGRIVFRGFGWGRSKQLVASLVLGAAGLGAGFLAVIATFYESTWAPPPQITFVTPPGFRQDWVFVLEDPTVSRQLVWQGVEMPFSGRTATVDVAAHGIVRVQKIGALGGRVDIRVRWSDGSSSNSQGGGPAPTSTGATVFSAFNRVKASDTAVVDPPFDDRDALGAHIMQRERATP
jgi:hypothetical protein